MGSGIKTHHRQTKIYMEEYGFVWKIKDFPQFQGSPDFLANQRICFNIGSKINLPTKWHCFLQKSQQNGKTQIYLELLDSPPDATKIVVNFQVYSTTGSKKIQWFESAFNENMWENGKRHRKQLPHLIDGLQHLMQVHCKNNGGALVLHVSVTLYNLDRTKRLTLFDRRLSNWKERQEKNFSAEIASRYKMLKKENADTVFISSDGKEFPVLRNILCDQSVVFASMFQSGMQEANGIVKISDVSGKALKLLFEYIHTGNLNEKWTKPEIIEEFVYASHKYMLKDLVNFQDKMLGYYCTAENVDGLLDLAKLLELKQAEIDLTECKIKGIFWREFLEASRVWKWKYLKFQNIF